MQAELLGDELEEKARNVSPLPVTSFLFLQLPKSRKKKPAAETPGEESLSAARMQGVPPSPSRWPLITETRHRCRSGPKGLLCPSNGTMGFSETEAGKGA